MNKSLTLDGIFSDGIVLQRDRENTLWGSFSGETVPAAFLDGESCPVSRSGNRFTVTLPAQTASSGRTVTITCGDETCRLQDVCFGEVFLLSGQSNMELPVSRVLDISGSEAEAADNTLIRHFRVEPRYMFGRQAEEIVPAPWLKAVYPDVLEFSAAGYFFALKMYEELGVPIGLVLNAMGGSTVEAWMPEEELLPFGGGDVTSDDHAARLGKYAPKILPYYPENALENKIAADEQANAAWHESLKAIDEAAAAAAIPEGTESFTVPSMTFGTSLEGMCGSVWFYREVVLDSQPSGEGLLYLGELVDSDRTYINGQFVGETTYRYPTRKYAVPAGLLRQGSNLIASRLVINNCAGGFIPDHPYYLDTGSQRIDLTGTWQMKRETTAESPAPEVLFPPYLPVGLYNASLHPLKGLQFAGLLWYQGESNADDPDRYSEKFNTMISVWRRHLEQPLPVVCTELCDFIDPAVKVFDPSGWAQIQRQQLAQPQVTSLCAAIHAADLGESFELHPQRKAELGERLAVAMLKLAYNKN